MSISVLCVDDSADITSVLSVAISGEEDMRVAGELHTADGLVEHVKQLRPDVIILDLTIPGVDVFQSLKQVTSQCPQTRTIAFSGHDDQEIIERARKAGAWAFVSKHDDPYALLDVIRQVAADQRRHLPLAQLRK